MIKAQKGEKLLKKREHFNLEEMGTYNAVFDSKKEDIGSENAYFWNVIL